MPEAIPGLFIGCILANIVSGCVLWDIIFCSIATLLGAIGAYFLRGVPEKFKWVCTLPNLLTNAVIVPFVLMYAYGVEDGFFPLALSVGIGELVCGVIGGTTLYYSVYAIAMPLAFLILRGIPAAKVEKNPFTAGQFFSILLICRSPQTIFMR